MLKSRMSEVEKQERIYLEKKMKEDRLKQKQEADAQRKYLDQMRKDQEAQEAECDREKKIQADYEKA